MRYNIRGKYNQYIEEFNKLFSLDKIKKFNDNELIENFFGCNNNDYSTNLSEYVNKFFRTSDLQFDGIDINFSVKYNIDRNAYVGFDKSTGKIVSIDKHTILVEANRVRNNILLIEKYYKQIYDVCNRFSLNGKLIYDIGLIKLLNDNFRDISYGERVILAAYFPNICTCFKSNEDQEDCFNLYKIEFSKSNVIENMINMFKYCRDNRCNTFDVVYSYYNFSENKYLVINLDFLKYTQDQFNRLIKFGIITLNKEYKLSDSNIPFKVNLVPFENYNNELIYFYFNKSIGAKFIIDKCIISKKTIEIELRDYKKVNIKRNIKNIPSQLIERSVFNLEFTYTKYPIIEKLNKVLQENKNLDILSKLNLIYYLKKSTLQKYNLIEKELFIIVDIDKKELIKVVVLYNQDNGKYYMDRNEFNALTKSFSRRKIMIELYDENEEVITFGEGESYLYLLGYNVRANNGLTDKDRKDLLLNIISNCYIDKYEIISHLTKEIQKRSNLENMKEAINKWQSDIRYLRDLHTEVDKSSHIYYVKSLSN